MTPEQDEQQKVQQMIADLNSGASESSAGPVFDSHEVIDEASSGDKPIDTPHASKGPLSESFTAEKAKLTANTWVKWMNSLMKMSFPWFYRKTILDKGDEEKMASFVRTHRGKTEKEMHDIISNDDVLWPVQTRFDRYLKALEAAPMTEEEMGFIAEPLSELIVKYRWMQLGPEWSLVIAVFLVMLPRLEPIMPGLGKMFSGSDKDKK